jgi:hypothetical protein
MLQTDLESIRDAQARFTSDLAQAGTQEAVFEALFRLSDALVQVRLWTVMTVDLEAGVARRAYTNMPEAYPASGTKPIVHNAWFDIVHGQHACFVANTLAEIAEVFPDHDLIGRLGCGSVLNLPVLHRGALLATVNLFDVEGYFTPERVKHCRDVLGAPALEAVLAARALPENDLADAPRA